MQKNIKKITSAKLFDLFILIVLLIVGAATSLVFRLDLFYSVIIYLFLPSVYLIFREKKDLKKIIIASLIIGVFFGMSWNFIAEYYLAWQTNYSLDFLNYIIIGNTPLADVIWGFLIPFSVIIFYEHFLDIEHIHVLKRKSYLAVIWSIVFLFIACFWIWFGPHQPKIGSYVYAIMGALACLPLVGLIFERKVLILKTFLCGLYFALVNTVFEVTALILGQWSFPGSYLIDFEFVKGNPIPLEEIIFWILPSAMVFVILFEYLFDDFK